MKKKDQAYQTKLKLAMALKNKMRVIPFNKISVTELINECGYNRKTFYYHFQDIRELLRWYIETEAENSLPNDFDTEDDYEKALETVIDYVKENERFVTNVYNAVGREGLKKIFKHKFSYITRKVINEEEEKQNIKLSEEHKEIIACFFTEALGGVVIDTFQNHNGEFSKDFCQYIINAVSVSLTSIIHDETQK